MFKFNKFMLFLSAPFIGLFITIFLFQESSKFMNVELTAVDENVNSIVSNYTGLKDGILSLGLVAKEQKQGYEQQEETITNLSQKSDSHRKLSDDIYEKRILDMLGPPIEAHISDNVEIKVFRLSELGYRGYIAKVKLFNPKSFKVALGKDRLGSLETTSQAARRKKAILAINGGGFYRTKKNGQSYAQLIGNTVINGKLVEPFNGYPGDLFFAGINKSGELIGNVPQKASDLTSLNPYQGVSFIPVLLKNGKKVSIPKTWKTTNQPRTIIGTYANDDIIMIVIDGRRQNWSKGVTLERLQTKLLELGVKEAYNLDGGGSSAMYYNGKLLNKPSDGRERPVVNNILIMP